MATKFCAVATNICGSLLWNVLCVSILGPRIFEVVARFLEILCTPGVYVIIIYVRYTTSKVIKFFYWFNYFIASNYFCSNVVTSLGALTFVLAVEIL